MLRGAKKNMIVVRTRDSRMFEEAYFVMRRDAHTAEADELDILWEANRILESTVLPSQQDPSQSNARVPIGKLRKLLWFGFGLLSGGGTVGLLWILL